MRAVMLRMIVGLLFVSPSAGCGATARQVVRGIVTGVVDLAECAPEEYASVQGAILHGGVDWLGAILGAAGCVQKVIRDVTLATKVADASGEVQPLVISKGARKRMRVADVLSTVVLAKGKP